VVITTHTYCQTEVEDFRIKSQTEVEDFRIESQTPNFVHPNEFNLLGFQLDSNPVRIH